MTNRILRQRYRRTHKLDRRIAILGDGSTPSVVRVPGRPKYVNVRYPASDGNTSSLGWPTVVKMTINIDESAGKPVTVGWDDEDELAVLGASTRGIAAAGGNPIQAAQQGEQNKWVDLNKSPLLWSGPFPGKPLFVVVTGMPYVDNSRVYHDFRGISGGVDLEPYLPGSTGEWCLVALFLKTDDTVEVVASTPKSSGPLGEPLSSVDVQECLDGAETTSIPISIWILRNEQTEIADTDKYIDWRQWINVVGGGASSLTVTDGATTVTDITEIDFNGSDFSVSDLGGGVVQIDAVGSSADDTAIYIGSWW